MTILEKQLSFHSNYTLRDGAPMGIVLHHAAGLGSVEQVHAFHQNENGWAGIGYHFYVRRDGNVYRGRPENWLGAHTSGHNDMIGICAEGHFDNDPMYDVQQNAIIDLLAYLRERYGALTVYAHRDLDATSCPGKNFPFEAIVTASAGESRVKAFQKAALADGFSLPEYGADGIWGLETASVASKLLANGSIGERVRFVQRRLMSLGFDLGDGADDSIFGNVTERAVKAYQSKQGLAVDGIVGIETMKALLGV